jgi:hypothetical protein
MWKTFQIIFWKGFGKLECIPISLIHQFGIKIIKKMVRNRENHLSQIDKANAILLELKPNITTTDREEAQKELELSMPTIIRYLNGDAKKIDTAMVLIGFFKERIQKREKELTA